MSEDFPVHLARLPEGSRLAGYRIEAPLGAGGMAVVYRAHDERLNRPVALKIFAPTTAADKDARQRFIRESQTAAAVDHEHIIPIYEAGEERGFLFIAMRLVRGGDLRRLLEREGTLPPARTAGIVSQVASALDAAHEAGLVHRDVKPANILLATPEGRSDYAYLSDFGVSKRMRSTSLTGTGQFLGTPDYAAPEQVRDVKPDGRADQYALACVAYHLLTGAPPFERHDSLALLMAHVSEPPPSVRMRRPELPEAVDRVLARALAKVPETRYGSCQEFGEALRRALSLVPGQAAAPTGPQTVTSTDRLAAGRLADRSRQATQSGTSSLLQPPPPGAGPARPKRATDRGRGILQVAKWGLFSLVVVAAVGLAVFKLVTHHSPHSPHSPKSVSAGDQVPTAAGSPVNPAQQPPGVSRQIQRIVAVGNRIVTTGSQTTASGVSQQFFVSADGGATWHQATMRWPDGRPMAGHTAGLIAGGPHGWLAEGPQAIWTSKNGLSWTLAATHGITPQQAGDSIDVVTATADGFLVGGAGKAGGNQAVIWISPNATTWQRLTATQLGLTSGGKTPANIAYATSRGNATLISNGSGVWLSTDGGTSWTQVTVPVTHGASNVIQGLSFDSEGLIAVRRGTGTTGAPDGVAYFSPNGQVWQLAGPIDPAGGWTPQKVKGSDNGLVVVGVTAGQYVAYTSTDSGATWLPTKPLIRTSGTSMIDGATVGSGGTVIAVGSAGQHVVFIKTHPEP